LKLFIQISQNQLLFDKKTTLTHEGTSKYEENCSHLDKKRRKRPGIKPRVSENTVIVGTHPAEQPVDLVVVVHGHETAFLNRKRSIR